MNISGQFCLKWDEFSENISSTLSEERNNVDFTDVTLVCEDGTKMEAHKLVLSGGSNLLNKMLRLKKGSSSIIYMRGLKNKNLTAIMDFLYHGEVSINQDDLHEFLAIAEEFQLKGMVGVKEEFAKKPENINGTDKQIQDKSGTNSLPDHIKEETIKENPIEEDPKTNNFTVTEDNWTVTKNENMDQKMIKMIDMTDENWKCNICGKEAGLTKYGRKNLKRHTQTHMEGLTYTCNLCWKEFRYQKKADMAYKFVT